MKYFIHLPMKMEPIVSSETSAIRTQTPGNYPKRNNLQLNILSVYLPSYFLHLNSLSECQPFMYFLEQFTSKGNFDIFKK